MKSEVRNIDLFGDESKDEYSLFVDKFKAKKTTDDCYTPPLVYDIILKYVTKNYNLSGNIIRPFYPTGNYRAVAYSESDIVIDNPPFSIITEICRYYISNNVKFFLFAPHMTLFTADINATYIVCGANIVYENGAIVKTSFISNVLGELKVIAAVDLYNELSDINKKPASLPKYKYPDHILTVSNVQKYVENGINFCLTKSDTKHFKVLDSQRRYGKAIFGAGLLLSDKAAADKAAADKAAADKAAADKANITYWTLSEREIGIIKNIGKEGFNNNNHIKQQKLAI